MHDDTVPIGEETGARKIFVWAIDWPGWCRGAKTTPDAIDALVGHGPRYAVVARTAGLELPDVSPHDLVRAVSVPGGSGTDFGVPSAITDDDRRPVRAEDATRLVAIVEAAWTVFEQTFAAAPAELRKGPRGGGRDRDKIVRHVDEADHAYSQIMGIKVAPPDRARPATVAAMRRAMLDAIGAPSDGSPIAGASGRLGTRPGGSPGMRSTTRGRSRTGPSARQESRCARVPPPRTRRSAVDRRSTRSPRPPPR